MSSLIEDGHCVECANLRADYAHAQNRIRELTETLARRTDALHLLEGERNQAKALLLDILQKGGKFLAHYSQQHGDDLAETDEEMALTDACNEFGDALDAARAALPAPDGATGGGVMDAAAWLILADLLDLASQEFSNHGCNDYELDNTPENYAILEAIERDNVAASGEEPYPVRVSPDGTKLWTGDSILMGYFATLARRAAAPPPPAAADGAGTGDGEGR